MFFYSFRLSSLKLFSVILLSVAALFCLVAFVPPLPEEDAEAITYSGIDSPEDRLSFISQFGWQVENEQADAVTIPEEFDEVYEAYNELQKEQGLSLVKYKGKEVTRYTYRITNYPDYEGEVNLTLLVYKNKVVGGEIEAAEENGFRFGLAGEQKAG